MANIFNRRGGFSGRPDIDAAIDIAGGVRRFARGKVTRAIADENQHQVDKVKIAMLAEQDRFKNDFMTQNADRPDLWPDARQKSEEEIRRKLLEPVYQPGARKAATAYIDQQFAQWKSSVQDASRSQLLRNQGADFKKHIEALQESKSFENLQGVQEHMQIASDVIGGNKYLTPDEKLDATRDLARQHYGNFLLESALETGQEDLVNDPNTFLTSASVEFEGVLGKQALFDNNDVADLKKRFGSQKKYRQDQIDAAEKEAITDVGRRTGGLAAKRDFIGAQAELDANAELLGLQAYTTQSRNLQSVSKIVGDGGPNYYEVTHKPSVRAQLRADIVAGRITDDAFVWQRTGENGISKPDAELLSKMIPTGGTAKDFRDSDAAKFYKEKFDQTLIGGSKQELTAFAEETGYRWLQQWQDDNPDATLRQSEEEAWRISRRVSEAALAGEITTDIEDLPKTPLTPEQVRQGMEELDKIDLSKIPKTVRSDADYDKLASGTVFRDESGKRYRKP